MKKGVKIFSPETANAALAKVRPLLHELRTVRHAIQSKEIDIDVAMILASDNGKQMDKVAPATVTKDMETYNAMVEDFNQLAKRFADLGCELKDLEQGLVDFYAVRDGNLAYLCWKDGEEKITHWHTLESGFAGRQPL